MSDILNTYKEAALRMAKLAYPQASIQELSQAIDFSINKRFKDTNIQVVNNYKKKTLNTSLQKIADYVLKEKPITTAYGVMFKRHLKDKNTPFYDLLETFINNRTKFKNKMFEYPKGSDEFQKYNLLQLLAKLDCNATYGILAQYSSLLYNVNIAGSITAQGRNYTSAAILFFEQFLSDNVQWANFNEIITFIDQVVHEDKRVFNDCDFLDRDITLEEVYLKIMKNCGFNGWYPTYKEMRIVWDILARVSQADLNRLYYRNNLYEFCDNTAITKAIVYILEKLDTPFLDPNKPPASIKDELKFLADILADYVYHPHLCFNRVDRVRMMKRNISIITDTDSTIVSFDGWYRYVKAKVDHLDLKLNSWLGKIYDVIKPDEFGDYPLEKLYAIEQPEYVFDFVSGEMLESKQKLETLYTIDAKDNLRYSIISIMGYIASVMLDHHMNMECRNYNTASEERKCLIVMKNEFLFKRALVTLGKKNYASYQEMQEGHLVPLSAALDMKGMPLSKSILKEDTKVKLQKIIFEDILGARHVDQINILNKVALVEKSIVDNLKSGDKKYYKPLTFKSHHSYANPMGIQGIKASVIYNTLKDDNEAPIDLEVRNSADVVKLNVTKENLMILRDQFPEVYERYNQLIKTPEFSNGITYVAIPLDAQVPKWVIPLIDYDTIVNDNLKNFPFECIGVNTHNRDSINYTNHIAL